jgi:hypothetical protein
MELKEQIQAAIEELIGWVEAPEEMYMGDPNTAVEDARVVLDRLETATVEERI